MARRTPAGSDDLICLVDRWERRKIVVVGDFMLDRYVYGDAERMSPDAPVPVLAARREEIRPGGAAHLCLALRALRCDVACLGVAGRDRNGTALRGALRDAGCGVRGLLASSDRPTSVKHNFVGLAQHRHPQKMFRLDEERTDAVPKAVARRLLANARQALQGAAALCLEDYDKGVLGEELSSALINLARRKNVPVLVDPAAIEDYGKYRGATCITPNRTEAALATGCDANGDLAALGKMARKLLRELSLRAVVVTLDRHGALLLERGKRPRLVPTRARSIYDVTGAGDMVLAMLTAATANGADWPAAVQLANEAAGLEIQKFGVVAVDLDEVLLTLLEQRHEKLGKLRALEQLLPELAAHHRQGRTIAFTNGCFDILHAGHISYLRKAAEHGDLLVVAVNSDASIRRIKGSGRPVNRQADRLMVLSELQSVDYLIVFDEDTPMRLIRAIKPQVLVKGGDYKRSEVVGGDFVERRGGRVVLVNPVRGRSTTNIIRRIAGNG